MNGLLDFGAMNRGPSIGQQFMAGQQQRQQQEAQQMQNALAAMQMMKGVREDEDQNAYGNALMKAYNPSTNSLDLSGVTNPRLIPKLVAQDLAMKKAAQDAAEIAARTAKEKSQTRVFDAETADKVSAALRQRATMIRGAEGVKAFLIDAKSNPITATAYSDPRFTDQAIDQAFRDDPNAESKFITALSLSPKDFIAATTPVQHWADNGGSNNLVVTDPRTGAVLNNTAFTKTITPGEKSTAQTAASALAQAKELHDEQRVTVVDPATGKNVIKGVNTGYVYGEAPPTATSAKSQLTKANAEKEKGIVTDIVREMAKNLKGLADSGALVDTDKSATKNISARSRATDVGQYMEGFAGTKDQTYRDNIDLAKTRLLMHIKQLEGIGVGGLNSNMELQTHLKSLGSTKMSKQSNEAALSTIKKIIDAAVDSNTHNSTPATPSTRPPLDAIFGG